MTTMRTRELVTITSACVKTPRSSTANPVPTQPMVKSVLSATAMRGGDIASPDALDSPAQALLESLVALLAQTIEAPMAFVGVLESGRIRARATVGLDASLSASDDDPFAALALASVRALLVPDTGVDVRFTSASPASAQAGVRSFAGLPLLLPDGSPVGVLYVCDTRPRRWSRHAVQLLASLAGVTVQALAMQREQSNRWRSLASAEGQALAASEARHRALVDEQTEMVSLARPDGELLFVNATYAAQFDRTPAEMIGTNLFDHVDGVDRPAVRSRFLEVLQSGATLMSENGMVGRDGTEIWVAWTNRARAGDDGETWVHSVGRDVTERRRVELALRASESLLQRTGRVAGVGGWQLEIQSDELVWSEQTRRIHEVDPEFQPTLQNAIGFYAPSSRIRIEAAVGAGMEHGTPWDLELQITTAKGRELWVRAVGEVEFESGKASRLLGAFQDITERKRLERRVADSERFLRQVTDNLPLRVAYVDSGRRYRFANRELLSHLGRTEGQVIGRTRAEILPDGHDQVFASHASAALSGAVQRFEFDDRVNGQIRRFENRLVPDFSEDGTVQGFFVTGIDITERSAAEKVTRELAAIFENTTDYVVQANPDGQVIYMNPAARVAFGILDDELMMTRRFFEFNSGRTHEHFASDVLPALTDAGIWLGETEVTLRNGAELPVSHLIIAHRDASHQVERYSAVMRDISVAAGARLEIMRQSAILRSVADAIPATVAVMDSAGRYRFVNRAFERACGRVSNDILGRAAKEILGDAEFERRWPWVRRALAGETVEFEVEQGLVGELQHLAISYIPLTLDSGKPEGFVVVTQDVSSRKQKESRLLDMALRDPLTQLLNRTGFARALEQLEDRDAAGGVAVLYIDLDHFKPVNDRYGHPVGDEVLRKFAKRMGDMLRPTDAVARLGGDEFAIALDALHDQAGAELVAAKLLGVGRRPFQVGTHSLQIGVSVGLAFQAERPIDWSELIARADRGLIKAKELGRDQVMIGLAEP